MHESKYCGSDTDGEDPEGSKCLNFDVDQAGLSLDLHASDRARAQRTDSSTVLATRRIVVRFELPDESVSEASFQLGQTVEVLKAFLAAEFDIRMSEIGLEYNGRILLDPFSLNDIVSDTTEEMQVFVLLDHATWSEKHRGK
mmetsp:Transcript_6635/g.12258  ORF Transcript_6635/g.12258 Transcript_6635/m.12258 type:complete len:142 (-) Transcript_6635:138-563(-)|eukprot:CAMPEP_0184528206 /NCGR_PEP_ID=MMETSP0198_2-20121128/11662_1 /TAXON_ID=1112570 /ORGANISM="Thraustochytrium sp., Strain LLF1b" /LENGTH=141 /DNA_ID=CAMNT_0026920025 /DNA_START=77 /DNA_END=502 /DNA_ORIENTATION=+